MLSRTEIENLIHLRMPEPQVREILMSLTPGRVELETFHTLVQVMRETSQVTISLEGELLDCCGTGGSGLPHFNVSTAVAFVLAAGGVKVAKFGNRAITSRSGSFDLLEQLGIPTEIPLDRIKLLIERTGLVFLFAPQCYPTLKAFHALRKSLGFRTIFNFIGPLLHPLNPAFRLLGVSDSTMQFTMAEYLAGQPYTQCALVVRGEDSLDEITYRGKSYLYEVKNRTFEPKVTHRRFSGTWPEENGFFSPQKNLAIFQNIIEGKDTASAYFWQVCENAGAGFYVAGKASSIAEGASLAESLLLGKKVKATVEECQKAYADYLA